jgi:hypothetical protein
MKNLSIIISSILFLGLTALFPSCKKDDLDAPEFERMFAPGTFDTSLGQTEVKIDWKPSLYAEGTDVTYSVQLSTKDDFSTVDYSVETDTNSVVVTDQHIAIRTSYFVRIRTNGSDKASDSHWITAPATIRISGAQIIQPIASADLGAKTVTLRWTTPGAVTHFMIGATRYDISSSEATAGEKTITGLTPETEYTAVIYNNTLERGTRTFTTGADLPSGPNVVIVAQNDDLAGLISNAVNGNTFVLLRGTKYTSDVEINIPNGVSFTIWGQGGGAKPVLAFNGFKLPAVAGTIKFENIDITGYQNADATQAKRNYIFNQSTTSNTAEINFENCIIRNFVNTPLRLQSTNLITIGKFTVNRSIIYDIGDNGTTGNYAFIHSNVATGKVNNISITNNTFYKIGYSLILHNAAPSVSVIIENNTFYNVIGNGRYLIDYNAQTVGTFSFRNNIIGKTLSPANTARGIRYSGSNLVVTNSYKTNDAIFAGNLIPNIIDYSNTSAALFTAPDNGNFLIKDGGFAGKADSGDPRWRP